MQQFKHFFTSTNGDTSTIWLDRNEKGNALSIDMIRALTRVLREIEQQEVIRFVLLRAKGPYFCTGADLEWMSAAIKLSEEENRQECFELAELYRTIYASGKIFIAMTEGPSYGGGVGLAAVCDIVYGTGKAKFSFSEVRLGMVPAIITPYVVIRTGARMAKLLILTGETISPVNALNAGLIDFLTDGQNIEKDVESLMDKLRLGGKSAQQVSKKLLRELEILKFGSDLLVKTSAITALARIGPEGREGIEAFLQKREPTWRS